MTIVDHCHGTEFVVIDIVFIYDSISKIIPLSLRRELIYGIKGTNNKSKLVELCWASENWESDWKPRDRRNYFCAQDLLEEKIKNGIAMCFSTSLAI